MQYKPDCYLTADIVLVAGHDVLLICRKNEPFRGSWCFPGGFVDPGETVLAGAERELKEETGVTGMKLDQFGAYGDPGRDPRGRTVAVVYWSRMKLRPDTQAGDDATECGWFSLEQLPPMGFDHGKIAQDVRNRLRQLGWW